MLRRMSNTIDLGLAEKLSKELKDGLLICYRVKNNRLDYSVMNRPNPDLSSIDDHALATILVYAGRTFALVHNDKPEPTERVARDDGRTVNYNEQIDIDFEARRITSTRRKDMTLTVLEAVIATLLKNAPKPTSLN